MPKEKSESKRLDDEQVMKLLTELEGTLHQEVKYFVDWTHSKNNQGTWLKKTMLVGGS